MHRTKEHPAHVGAELSPEGAIEREGQVKRGLGAAAAGAHLLPDAALEELPQGGHAHHGRHARTLEGGDDLLAGELVEVDHRRAARQRQEHAAGKLKRVVQRQHRQHAVALAEGEDGREGREQRGEVAVGQHHALGGARRARGVDDARHGVGRGADVLWGRERVVFARDRVQVEALHGARFGDGVEGGGDLRIDEGRDGPGGAQDVAETERVEARVDGHGDGARAQNAEVRDGPVGVVGGAQHHAVAGLDPRGGEARGDEPPGAGLPGAEGDAVERPPGSVRSRAAWWSRRSAASSSTSRSEA